MDVEVVVDLEMDGNVDGDVSAFDGQFPAKHLRQHRDDAHEPSDPMS